MRSRLVDRYKTTTEHDCDLANEWWSKFSSLSLEQMKKAKEIIAKNKFKDGEYECDDKDVCEVLQYYKITRDATVKSV